MANKPAEEASVRVTLTGKLRQDVNKVAKDSLQTDAAQARYLIQLGLLADKAGMRIKNGQLKHYGNRAKAS